MSVDKQPKKIEDKWFRETKEPVQKRSRETRRKILAAAKTLFSEIGFEAATTHLIAKTAGVSVGGLYAHFPNKEEIFLQIIADRARYVFESTRSRLEEAGLSNMNPEKAIEHIFASSYEVYIRDVKLNLEVDRFCRVNSQAAEIHDYWENEECRLVAEWLGKDKSILHVNDVESAVIVTGRAVHEVFQYLYKNHGRVDAAAILDNLTLMIKRFLFKQPGE